MPTSQLEQPLVLFHDSESCTARAAALPPDVSEDSEELLFNGVRFARDGGGIAFWDYLVLGNGDIVGVVLINFEVDEVLATSPLLTASYNIVYHEYGYGYHVQLAATNAEPEIDGAQAFGCSLYRKNNDCLLLLPDWHQRGYGFSLVEGLIHSVQQRHPT